MMKTRYISRPIGFTLLEILIAIAIFAVIVSILFPAYTGTFRNMEAAEADSEFYQMARITLDRITEDLESAYASNQVPFTGEDNTIDGQRADTVQFMSRAHLVFSSSQNVQGNAQIAYYVKENNQENEETGLTLYRSDTLELMEPPEQGTGGLVLCEGLHSFTMTYFDEEGEAHDTWDSSSIAFKNRLPARVSVLLAFVNRSDPESPLPFKTSVIIPLGGDQGVQNTQQ
jgi:general secretion pathway protein J